MEDEKGANEVKVEVEYCGGCGYLPRFEQLKGLITETVPTADVVGKEGRTGSFEVAVNGTLIYSKLSTMAFPDFDNVTDIVRSAAEGKDVQPVSKQQPIDCIIL